MYRKLHEMALAAMRVSSLGRCSVMADMNITVNAGICLTAFSRDSAGF